MPYYVRQLAIALGAGLAAGYLLGDWITGAAVAISVAAGALWAPRSGHFVVDASRGARALYEDERSRAIRARASEVAFQVVLVATCVLWYVVRASGAEAVPHGWVASLVLLGVATQVVSDLHLRRSFPADSQVM